MKNKAQTLYFFFFDDIVTPKKITGYYSCSSINDDDITYVNVGDIDYFMQTPLYRFDTVTHQEFEQYVLPTITWCIHSKNLYKLYPHLKNIKDPLYYLHIQKDYELPQLFHAKNMMTSKFAPYRTIIQKVYKDMSLIYSASHGLNLEPIVRTTAKLDNHVFVGDNHVPTFFTGFTRSLRLRDELSSSINMKKEERIHLHKDGLLVNVDFDGAHLRILDKLSGEEQIIPNNQRAVDYITNTATDVRVFKTDIYATMYSEKFDRINHPLFKRVKQTYKSYQSPFGVKNIPFNYIIQHYEVKMICDLVETIDSLVKEYYFYHYDGLTFSIYPDKLNDFNMIIKEFANKHPLKLNILNKTYYVN
jgi:hypothetical protein